MTTVPGSSSYLRHLPPVLAEESADRDLPLGDLLRVFEKLLTGLPDEVAVVHDAGDGRGPHRHAAVGEVIDRLQHQLDPWTVDARFLPWLASWVSLELPPRWEERQRRRAVAAVAGIHAQRGRREGLRRYLDLHTATATRPRVAIDDGSAVLFLRPNAGRAADVHTLVPASLLLGPGGEVVVDGIVHPTCMAVTPEHELVLGDLGGGPAAPSVRPGLWRVTRTGEPEMVGVPPRPRRLGPPQWTPGPPVALAVEGTAASWRLWLLDAAGALHRLAGPHLSAAERVADVADLGILDGVALVADGPQRLLLLDRGDGSSDSAALVELDVRSTPARATRHVLAGAVEPRTMTIRSDGLVVVGEAGRPDTGRPADLLLVDRGSGWTFRRLLASLPRGDNPVVAPTAVLEEDTARLLVLDVGLDPTVPDPGNPFVRAVARPATLHRVDLSGPAPQVTEAARSGRFVFPTGAVAHEGTVYVCDPGEPYLEQWPRRPWRTADAEFGVLVHFSRDVVGEDPDQATQQVLRTVVEDVRRIVAEQAPARTLPSVVTTV